MIKKILFVAIASMFTFGTMSCREEESLGDKVEDVADDIEDSVD